MCYQALFNRLVSLTEEARRAYKEMVCALEQEQAEEALKNVKKVPHHMGHSRNPSAASAISFCSVISEPIPEVNEKEYGTPDTHTHTHHVVYTTHHWLIVTDSLHLLSIHVYVNKCACVCRDQLEDNGGEL